MPTPYSLIYQSFLGKINDFNFAKLDDDTLTSILRGYLQSSIVKFTKDCRQDLSQRDETNSTFTITLTDIEVEILAMMMVDAWLEIRINDDAGLKQVLTDNDFQIHSQANHIATNMQVRTANWTRVQKLINNYLQQVDISGLSTNKVQPNNPSPEGAYSPQDLVDDYYYGH
ncbi:hypothetical protein QB910_000024 [Dabrowskivirus KKP3916]|uniref:Uncharacterized protein n=1 Tax=Alicyclobacillus phage KKP_3916 TaxID=3040651 RepID=A0AAT9V7H1_9CAUD|nr:hypothetical protein QB910_000024 [Alicyclobacillus phage KKP 3916]